MSFSVCFVYKPDVCATISTDGSGTGLLVPKLSHTYIHPDAEKYGILVLFI